jgi:LysM repeat protein
LGRSSAAGATPSAKEFAVAEFPWTIDIDQALYERAAERARSENQHLDQVVLGLLSRWVSAPATTYHVYTIRSGDSLAQIAARFYGDSKLYAPLAKFNNITDVTLLRVGQEIRIPPRNELILVPIPGSPVKEPTQPITGWPAPLRIEFIQSPHYNERPSDARIWTIVIHATANDSLEGVIRWFTNPTSLVSAHYNIGKDGRIVQMAREDQRAWHAGKSVWKDVPDVNDYSVGIELVNKNDGVTPYPGTQYRACVRLCRNLTRQYDIAVEDIMGHLDISLTGKTDPAGLDLEQLRRDVAAA